MPHYDEETLLFMKESAEGPMGKPPVSTFGATGSLPETMPETMPTRDAYPSPTAPQSPDNTQGLPPGSWPNGGEDRASGTLPNGGEDRTSGTLPNGGEDRTSGTWPGQVARNVVKATGKILSGGNPAQTIAKEGIKVFTKGIAKNATVELKTALRVFEELNTSFGSSWHDWEPETIHQMLGEGSPSMDMLGALQVLVNTNYAQDHWHVFEKVGHALTNSHVDFTEHQPLDIHECALTLLLINKIRPKSEFEPEIWHYIAACAKNFGWVYLPDVFIPSAAQEALDAMGNDMALKERVRTLFASNETKGANEAETYQILKLRALENYLSKFGV